MKFLVLALCVCAASAASSSYGQYKPVNRRAYAESPAKVVPVPVAAVKYTPPAPAPVAPAPYSITPVTKNANNDAEAEVLSNVSEFHPGGSYTQHVETNNGIHIDSAGELRKVGDANAFVVKGGYSYIAPDGTPVALTYIADENGYQPKSDFLPVGPPVPKEIQDAIKYITKNAPVNAEANKY